MFMWGDLWWLSKYDKILAEFSSYIKVSLFGLTQTDSDRGLFNIKLHTTVLHQVYIAEQYEHIEQIWTWHNQKYLLGDLY